MKTQPELGQFLQAVGQLEAPDEAHETYDLSLGELSLKLRRDCHGIMRKVELQFPPARRAQIRNLIDVGWNWIDVMPHEVEIADVSRLGRVFLLQDRLHLSLLLHSQQSLLVDLITRCADGALDGTD